MIVNIILDINSGINTWFRESKLPKFIKVLITKEKRKQVKKRINQYTNSDKYKFCTSDIYEFLSYSFSNLEGKYMYINSIMVIDEPGNNVYSASLTYNNIKQNKCLYHFLLHNVTNENMEITIKQENDKGTITLYNLKCKESGLIDFTEQNYSTIIVNLIGGLNAMIAEMIKDMLLKELEKSERIYEL